MPPEEATESTTALTAEEGQPGEQNPDTAGEQPGGEGEPGEKPGGEGEAAGSEAGESEKAGESPETYADFTLPEGVELDAAALEKAAPIFKELGLDQTGAQKLIDTYAEMVQAGAQRQVDSFNQTKQDWLEAAQGDKEIGGDKFDETVADAKVGLNKFGNPELKKLMNEFGIGNHPEVIRFMAKVGRLTKEDNPGSIGQNSGQAKDRVQLMYPSDSKE